MPFAAPLCPAGHLPRKGGDRTAVLTSLLSIQELALEVQRHPAFALESSYVAELLPDIGRNDGIALAVEDARKDERAARRDMSGHFGRKPHQRTGQDIGNDQVERRPP